MVYIVKEKIKTHDGDGWWKELYRGDDQYVAVATLLTHQQVISAEVVLTCMCNDEEWERICYLSRQVDGSPLPSVRLRRGPGVG